MICGLLGRKLGHSYSPAIHARMGSYEYRLFEVEPGELGAFLRSDTFDGLNVTIPYKKDVIPFCAELTDTARAVGAVNTIVRRADGSLLGDNTDYAGFCAMLDRSGADVTGRRALVLGSGGASATVQAVLRNRGADVTVVSRTGAVRYEDLDAFADARIIVNTTPVGMYPGNGERIVDLRRFPHLEAVFDVIYNPARTDLLLQAEELGIVCMGGLCMLVEQAGKASERFTGRAVDPSVCASVLRELSAQMENIILIGMPGSGKTTVGAALADATGRQFFDADAVLSEQAGKAIPEIFQAEGETGFRARESEVLRALGKRSGLVIATGGGCVTREENYASLHQNGRIIWLRRPLEQLSAAGRPLSQRYGVQALYDAREPLYRRFADSIVDNDASVSEAVRRIQEELQ